jgi:hypothetical protein
MTVLARLPGIGRPLVGNFATKNVVYAMIARNWAEGRASLLTPTLDCLADGQRAWHLVEFPVSAYVSGALWRWCGGSLDVWGRATSIAWSVASVALLYLLVRRWHGETAARAAAAMLALAPVSIIYGQSFMLEASVVALGLATFYAVERWRDARRLRWLALAAMFFARRLAGTVMPRYWPTPRRRLPRAFTIRSGKAWPATAFCIRYWRIPDSTPVSSVTS